MLRTYCSTFCNVAKCSQVSVKMENVYMPPGLEPHDCTPATSHFHRPHSARCLILRHMASGAGGLQIQHACLNKFYFPICPPQPGPAYHFQTGPSAPGM